MANIITRFSIYSNDSKNIANANILKNKLPKPSLFYLIDEPIRSNGSLHGKVHKETSFDYTYSNTKVDKIEVSVSYWMDIWGKHEETLILAKNNFLFNLYLNFEITVFDNNYPELYFNPDFLSFLGTTGVILSFYFYNN